MEAQRANPNDVPPVIATPHHYLLSIQRGGISLVAACMQEVPPLFVVEFLHRVVDTFQVRTRAHSMSIEYSFSYILGLFFRLHRKYYKRKLRCRI